MKRTFLALLLLILLLTGCAVRAIQAEPSVPPEETAPAEELPAARLIFAGDAFQQGYNTPDAVCYDHLEARRVQFDVEDVKSMLFTEVGDPVTVEGGPHENNGWTSYGAHSGPGTWDPGWGPGAFLAVEKGVEHNMAYFHVPWYDKYSMVVQEHSADVGMCFLFDNVDLAPQEGDLAFATAREAEDAVRAALDRMGFPYLENVEIYRLSKEVLREMEKDNQSWCHHLESETWTEEDECYFLVFRAQYDGITIARERLRHCGGGTKASAFYNRKGIAFLEANIPLEIIETGERIDMPTEAEARQRIVEKFEADMAERGCDVVVHEVSLEYVLPSRGGCALVPAWRVIMEEVDGIKDEEAGEAVSIWDCYFFNALTGEEYEGP